MNAPAQKTKRGQEQKAATPPRRAKPVKPKPLAKLSRKAIAADPPGAVRKIACAVLADMAAGRVATGSIPIALVRVTAALQKIGAIPYLPSYVPTREQAGDAGDPGVDDDTAELTQFDGVPHAAMTAPGALVTVVPRPTGGSDAPIPN